MSTVPSTTTTGTSTTTVVSSTTSTTTITGLGDLLGQPVLLGIVALLSLSTLGVGAVAGFLKIKGGKVAYIPRPTGIEIPKAQSGKPFRDYDTPPEKPTSKELKAAFEAGRNGELYTGKTENEHRAYEAGRKNMEMEKAGETT